MWKEVDGGKAVVWPKTKASAFAKMVVAKAFAVMVDKAFAVMVAKAFGMMVAGAVVLLFSLVIMAFDKNLFTWS